jgi:N-acylglucosamine 2-epimerase
MDQQRIDELIAIYRDGLLGDTLPFWLPRSVDQKHGGFMTARDRDGSILDTDKGVWQQGRFTWLLGELYNNVEPREEWLELAKHGAKFLDDHCFDPTDGRMWFHVTRDGRPIRKRRYAFSESFAAIAYGELAQATGKDHYVEKARRTFQKFIDHNLQPKGVQPKFTEVRPTKGIGFPMITINAAQQLRESIELAEANEWIDRSMDVIRSDSEMIETGCNMLDWMWHRGWDSEYGGLLYFTDVYGHPVQEYWHDMKFWWPHNEAIIATLLAYHLTSDAKYADWHRQVHDWAYQHFPDREHGEWFSYLHRDGRLSVSLKGNLWKGPFHLPRMQLTCWQILEEMKDERHSSATNS